MSSRNYKVIASIGCCQSPSISSQITEKLRLWTPLHLRIRKTTREYFVQDVAYSITLTTLRILTSLRTFCIVASIRRCDEVISRQMLPYFLHPRAILCVEFAKS